VHESRTYYVSRGFLLYFTAMLLAFVAFAAFFVLPMWSRLSRESFEFWFTTAWLLSIPWVAFVYLSTPFEIQLSDSRIRFRSLIRKNEIAAADVKSVTKGFLTWHVVTIRHSAGKVNVPSQIDGFYQFLSSIKELNPAVEIRGL
jgi:hypothetical protein